MKNKRAPNAEGDLMEKHQLQDVAWALQQKRKPEAGNWLTHTLKMFFSRLRARIAVYSIRNQARKNGLDKMTLKDINALIQKARRERHR